MVARTPAADELSLIDLQDRADALRDRVVRVVAARRRVAALRGRPPSLPFWRDDVAFRLDLTEPRHAGQNETRSI